MRRYFCRADTHAFRSEDYDALEAHPSNDTAQERYSLGYYAGMYCDACWKVHGLNHDDDGATFDPADAGERAEPDDP